MITRHLTCAFQADIENVEDFLGQNGPSIKALIVDGSRPIEPRIWDALPNLGLIACLGAGYEAIDMDAARTRGITVSRARTVNHEDVADLAIGLALSAVRGIGKGDRLIRRGGWRSAHSFPLTPSMRDLTFGIVGLGDIGSAIGKRISAFSDNVLWWGPRRKGGVAWPRAGTLLELARLSQVLFVAARAGSKNRHMIGRDILAALGPAGYLINISRGALIDEYALEESLRSGAIAGAALDVFDKEPPDSTKFQDLDNLTVTPHVGGWTQRSLSDATEMLIQNVKNFLDGKPVSSL
jgi:phosphoglycerate dehydrogenase-like enzyme